MKYKPKPGDVVVFGINDDYRVATNLNTATDLSNAFVSRDVKFPEGVTFASCTKAPSMFKNSLVESFPDSATFEKLTSASGMFFGASVQRLSSNMLFKNLVDGNSLFPDCRQLESIPEGATFEKMTIGRFAFAGCPKLHSLPESLTLRSLGASSEEMCTGTSLDEESVLRILDDEKGIQPKSGGSYPTNIGNRRLWKDSEAIAAKLGTTTPIASGKYSYKGWTITVEG